MTVPVPKVRAVDMITANKKAVADREAYGRSPDIVVSIITAFPRGTPAPDLLAITHRLYALANTLANNDARAWRTDVKGYSLLDEALVHAAARAPLMETETLAEIKFDPETLFTLALEEAEAEGRS